MAISQRDAVYQATLATLESKGTTFSPTVTSVKSVATDEVRETVVNRVFTLIKSGEVILKNTEANAKKLANDTKLKSYVSSLVSNHWSRDPQLNGGKAK